MLVELETEKVSLEVSSPSDGVLDQVAAGEGDTVTPGQVLGHVSEGAGAAAAPAPATPPPAAKTVPAAAAAPAGEAQPEPAPARPAPRSAPVPDTSAPAPAAAAASAPLSPSAQRIVAEAGLNPAVIDGSGRDGRITKGDALAALEARAAQPAPTPVPAPASVEARPLGEREERVRMTRPAPDHRPAGSRRPRTPPPC